MVDKLTYSWIQRLSGYLQKLRVKRNRCTNEPKLGGKPASRLGLHQNESEQHESAQQKASYLLVSAQLPNHPAATVSTVSSEVEEMDGGTGTGAEAEAEAALAACLEDVTFTSTTLGIYSGNLTHPCFTPHSPTRYIQQKLQYSRNIKEYRYHTSILKYAV